MRLNEQRDQLVQGVASACIEVKCMRAAVIQKMNAPYGDGSKSNMVNGVTDVLPRLRSVLEILEDVLDRIEVQA